MFDKIFHAEINGAQVACFDTGLNEQDFARAGLAKLLLRHGFIVEDNGGAFNAEKWKCEGVIERNGTMVIWGKDFAGAALDTLLADDARQNTALDAVRRWIKARIALQAEHELPAPGGTFVDDAGNFFFPPGILVQRCLEAGNSVIEKKERFVHPDLEGNAAAAWTLACMLYRIFCKDHAFRSEDIETLHQDMREGVFSPPRFAHHGIDKQFDDLIKRAFSRYYEDHPLLEEWQHFLGDAGSKDFAAFFHEPSPDESEKLQREKEKFTKSRNFSVKTRRFLTRNNVIILGIAVAVVAVGLIIGSVIYDRSQLPDTKGMTPVEVVQAYYKAMDELDHAFMQQAVLKKAGKEDIDMASSLFVLDKIRQSYRMAPASSILQAQEWLNSGAGAVPETSIVFGVSDLLVLPEDKDESDGEVTFSVLYNLWAPAFSNNENAEGPQLPGVQPRTDALRLALYKGAWRIVEIKRSLGE